jgi:putative hydrolase of the HAD superfamily
MEFLEVEWITFDMGGTLLFPNPSVGHVYAEVLARYGHERRPEYLEETFMRIWREDVQKCLPCISAESEKARWRSVVVRTFAGIEPLDPDRIFDDLWKAFGLAHRWRLPEKARETLHELRQRGYRLAVLSNWDERLRPLLDEMEISPLFEQVFVSCELGFEKPDPRIFRAVEAGLGATGRQILHVGDSLLHDIQGGLACGWNVAQAFCGADRSNGHPGFARMEELLQWLPSPRRVTGV